MSEHLQQWLTQELDDRKWSHRKLARQMGMSQSFVSKVIAGKVPPSVNFCHNLATALDVAPAQVLKLAGILPDEPAPVSPGPVTLEIMHLIETLSPEQRQEALRYLRYLAQQHQTD